MSISETQHSCRRRKSQQQQQQQQQHPDRARLQVPSIMQASWVHSNTSRMAAMGGFSCRVRSAQRISSAGWVNALHSTAGTASSLTSPAMLEASCCCPAADAQSVSVQPSRSPINVAAADQGHPHAKCPLASAQQLMPDVCAAFVQSQQSALLLIKGTLTPNGALPTWTTATNYCTWMGVTCNSDGYVTELCALADCARSASRAAWHATRLHCVSTVFNKCTWAGVTCDLDGCETGLRALAESAHSASRAARTAAWHLQQHVTHNRSHQ